MASPTLPLFLILLHLPFLSAIFPDANALLSFKSSADPFNTKLRSWNETTPICTWYGVSCFINGRVSKIVLESLSLSGPLPSSISSLSHLRVLSLSHNNFSGNIPDFSSLTSLKLLFLSHNRLSGEFSTSATPLRRLDLSFNCLSGVIPPGINRLTRLLTLRLEGNNFSGTISAVNLPNLQDFNVSGNNLGGEIPKSLAGFPKSAFYDNPSLCGPPLLVCKEASTDPTRPSDGNGAIASPLSQSSPAVVVSSSPTKIFPSIGSKPGDKSPHSGGKISLVAIVAIILGDILVLAVISVILYCYFWRNYKSSNDKNSGLMSGTEKIIYSSSPYMGQNRAGFEGGLGRMVFFEGGKKFELEDLLRASAEMLGKGVMGTAYKAVLDDGRVVAVKRLKEAVITVAGGGGRKEIEVVGRLRHENLVGLKAYYFAKEEKLLVFEYMPNGSLFWLLHGNRGPGRMPLDWATRLKIAAEAARGVAFIHNSCRALKLTHGNIKSTNVLIDKAGNARVSDFGLANFAPTSTANSRSNGYRAPEVVDGRKLTQKADVYSFGVLLLEILTGKCPLLVEGDGSYGSVGVGGVVDLPRWVQSVVREEWTAEVFDLELMRYRDIEEEMVGLLQIAMACTSTSPNQRPSMTQVVKMIKDIQGVEVPPLHETFDSDSPSVSEDTCGVSQ